MAGIKLLPAHFPVSVTAGNDVTITLAVDDSLGADWSWAGATVAAPISTHATVTGFTVDVTVNGTLTLTLTDTQTTALAAVPSGFSWSLSVTVSGLTRTWLAGPLWVYPANRAGVSDTTTGTLTVAASSGTAVTISGLSPIATGVTFTPTGTIAATTVQAAIAEVSTDVTDHLADTTDAHDASAISADSATLVGTGTTVQAVLEELDNGIADHLADTVDAHDASAISFTPTGKIAATDVQTAIAEVATDAASGRANTIRMRRQFSLPFDNPAALVPALMSSGAAANSWTMVNDVITPPAAEADWRVVLARDVVLGNGVARTTITNAASDMGGIVLQCKGVRQYLMFLVGGSSPVPYSVFSVNDGSFAAIVNGAALTDVDTNFAAPASMSMEVERRGREIKFRVNGRLIHTYNSTYEFHGAGGVGLVAHPSQSPTFRHLTVTGYFDPAITPSLTKVHAIGTSITAGVGASGPATYWPAVLGGLLQAGFTGAPVTVSNGGVNGTTSDGMRQSIESDLATNTPQVCIIETPVNDAQITVGMTPAQTLEYLQRIVAACRHANVTPVLWTSKPIDVAAMTTILGAHDMTLASHCKIADINNIARKIAAEEGVILADVSHAFNADSSATYTADGLHPNDAGHALIANTIYNAMIGAQVY